MQVTYRAPDNVTTDSIVVPLQPDTSGLKPFDVDMHHSPVRAIRMADKYNEWFSSYFGFPVILVYLGPRYRQTIGNLAPNAAARNPILRQAAEERLLREQSNSSSSAGWGSWLSKVANNMPGLPTVDSSAPANGAFDKFDQPIHQEDYEITFQDAATYMVTSETSLREVHGRMPDGEQADMTKFRPNIVIAGAEQPWEEDFWGELTFSTEQGNARLLLNHNCVRCTSLNVDYKTGKTGTNVLKLLQKDRRVDEAQKYSPVFGRYGWLVRGQEGEGAGFEIKVGDKVEVTQTNETRTSQKWPGLGSTPAEMLYPD